MNTSQKEKLLQTIHEWIRAADQKISIFLAFLGIIFTGAPQLYKSLFNNSFYVENYYVASFFIICSAIFFIPICFCLIWALKSKTTALREEKTKTNHKKSILFFNDIAVLDLNEFRNKINKFENYEQELENQIHANSKVCARKLRYFNLSITFFIILIFTLLASLVFYFYGI